MNDIELIKNQIKKINELREQNNPLIKEQVNQIKKSYLITFCFFKIIEI